MNKEQVLIVVGAGALVAIGALAVELQYPSFGARSPSPVPVESVAELQAPPAPAPTVAEAAPVKVPGAPLWKRRYDADRRRIQTEAESRAAAEKQQGALAAEELAHGEEAAQAAKPTPSELLVGGSTPADRAAAQPKLAPPDPRLPPATRRVGRATSVVEARPVGEAVQATLYRRSDPSKAAPDEPSAAVDEPVAAPVKTRRKHVSHPRVTLEEETRFYEF
jgi:hypothetical protein